MYGFQLYRIQGLSYARQAAESTAKKAFDFNSTDDSLVHCQTTTLVVDCRHYCTIQRTAFRILYRIFDVHSLPTDCHWVTVSRLRGLVCTPDRRYQVMA
eukprot:2198605-Pyramimonas_sp.AAC.1